MSKKFDVCLRQPLINSHHYHQEDIAKLNKLMTFTLPPFHHHQEFYTKIETLKFFLQFLIKRPFKKFVMHEEEKLIGCTGTQNTFLSFPHTRRYTFVFRAKMLKHYRGKIPTEYIYIPLSTFSISSTKFFLCIIKNKMLIKIA